MTTPGSRIRRPSGWLARVCAMVLLAGCAAGGRLHSEGLRLLAEGQRDEAIVQLREASRLEPTNSRYRIDLLTEQAAYGRELIRRADQARAAGSTGDALALYAKAANVDPGNERANRGIEAVQRDQRHARWLDDAERALKESRFDAALSSARRVLTEDPAHGAAKKLAQAITDQQRQAEQAKAELAGAQSMLRKPVTLQFRDATLRVVFEALSRITGLNVLLDRDVRADLRTTIFVKDATVEDTVDLILLQNQLNKRVLNANTLFIYPATTAKQREYQDLQVRTFQASNADIKYLLTVLKSVLKIREVSGDERTNTIVIRDTPEAIAVAAKVIAAHDVPDAEVMLEVEVLEVSRDRLSNIGLQLPTSLSIATPESANTIGALRALTRNDLTVTPLGATLNLKLEDTDANLLASPRIRARNKEKARILIGDRVPTITNTVTPVQTGTPVITGQVQYQEVGLKLEFEPQVYDDHDVGIKISLEVSNIVKEFTDAQGGRSYQIGTRTAQTSLRLRDGETQVLGGLITDQDRNAAAKVPGLSQLPLIGVIFGNNNVTRIKSELVLSITPRIIRAPAILDEGVRDIFSGTEVGIREKALRLDPAGEVRAPAPRPSSPVGPAPSAPAAPAVVPPAPPAPPAAPAVPAAVPAAPAASAPQDPSVGTGR